MKMCLTPKIMAGVLAVIGACLPFIAHAQYIPFAFMGPNAASNCTNVSYSTPGTYSFLVRNYTSLTVVVRGGSGGGGGGGVELAYPPVPLNNYGTGGGSGGLSRFGTATPLIAYGGEGGGGGGGTTYGTNWIDAPPDPAQPGYDGYATGGSTNTVDYNYPTGFAGTNSVILNGPYLVPTRGGYPGMAIRSWSNVSAGSPTIGSSITIIVGTGGTAGARAINGGTNGSAGAAGSVVISCF